MSTSGGSGFAEVEFEGEEETQPRANPSLTLVGRFLTNRPIRAHIMKERMAGVWRPGRGVSIREAGQGAFIFQFFHSLDVQKVLKQGPWSFDKNLLILSVIPEGVAATDVPLYQIPFWVQVHNVPTGFMSETIGKHVGNTMGTFLEYDSKNSSEFWRLYMRIRVLLDVTKPLMKGLKLKKKGGEAKEVLLKYERLDVFCYICGMLGHAEGDCDRLFEMPVDDGSRGWGPELRAEVRRGGGSGGARWLREENQDWVAPNCASNAGVLHGTTHMHGRNINTGGNGTSGSGSTHVNSIVTHNDISKLVEAFKDPSKLFPKPIPDAGTTTTSSGVAPRVIHDTVMVTEVDMVGDRKRMRGADEEDSNYSVNNNAIDGDLRNGVHEGEKGTKTMTDSFLMVGPGSGACQEQ